jgi:hypothetical protein
MFCPYRFAKTTVITQNRYEYKDGLLDFHECVVSEERVPAECDRDECGAFNGVECTYMPVQGLDGGLDLDDLLE